MSELQKYTWSDQHGALLRDDAIEVHPLEGTSFYKARSVDAARAADKARIEELQSRLSNQDMTMAAYINRERDLVSAAERNKGLHCIAEQDLREAEARIELLQRAVEESRQFFVLMRPHVDSSIQRMIDDALDLIADNIKAVKP